MKESKQVQAKFSKLLSIPFIQTVPVFRFSRPLFSTEEKDTMYYLCNFHNLISLTVYSFYHKDCSELNHLIEDIDDLFILVNKDTIHEIIGLSKTKRIIEDMISYVDDIKILSEWTSHEELYAQYKEPYNYMIDSVYKLKTFLNP